MTRDLLKSCAVACQKCRQAIDDQAAGDSLRLPPRSTTHKELRLTRMGQKRTVINFGMQGATPRQQVLDDPQQIKRVLDRALNDRLSLLRCPGIEASFRVRMAELHKREVEITLRPAVSGETFPALEVGKEMTWVLYAGNLGVLGFKAKLQAWNAGVLTLEIPTQIAQIQKRGEPRFTIPAAYEVNVRLGGGPRGEKFRVVDISATGISFLVSEKEATQFQVGVKLLSLTLVLRGMSFVLQGEVKGLAKDVDQGVEQRRVRVMFLNAKESDQDKIRDYVIEQLVQYQVYDGI